MSAPSFEFTRLKYGWSGLIPLSMPLFDECPVIMTYCFAAARIIGNILLVGGANDVIIQKFSNCVWRHDFIYGNYNWNKLDFFVN